MAGIGFQLRKIGQESGIGGLANAAIIGAFFSSGPWLMTAGAVLILNRWASANLTGGEQSGIQAILIYSFTISTLIAAPIAMLATRATADLLFSHDRASISAVFLGAVSAATICALFAGSVVFGVGVELAPLKFFFSLAIMVLLAQIWVVSPFLTAVKQMRPVLAAYLTGIAVTAVPIIALPELRTTGVLAAIAAGLGVTLLFLSLSVHREFPSPAGWVKPPPETPWRVAVLALTGFANALALGIDKWVLWFGPDSVRALGALRINPVNDQASFLGLLTIVPGLTLVLVVTETRFHTVFRRLLSHCTGTATYQSIERSRRDVATSILRDMRLLVVAQAVIAAFCWVLAPEIQQWVGGDARGIFGFRFTVVGVVFHIIALHATIIMSYYDLIPRVLAVWTAFAMASALATAASMNASFASFGWGYMVGAMAGATVALTLLAQATVRLNYLLFVGNNPAAIRRRKEFG